MAPASNATPKYAWRVRETATPRADCVSSASTASIGSLIELFFEPRHQLGEIAGPEADVELDEEGKPIKADAGEKDEFAGDESTVIVEENVPAAVAEETLFEEAAPAGKKKRRRVRSGE